MAPRSRLGRNGLYVVLVALAVLGVIGLTLFRDGAPRSVTHERDDTPLGPGPTKSLADHPKTDIQSTVASAPRLAGLTPADVMGNPDCIMRAGTGNGRDLAMVVVPSEDGSRRFAVVDGSGHVFGDTLPYPAVRDSSLARREDGSVVVGFAGSDRPLRRDFPLAPPFIFGVKGVVVYQDGQVIYENGEASRFGLADDGSSFYVMEPMAGDVSRLVIRNLDWGLEAHHDLANLQTANDGIAHISFYTIDQSEVVIQPFLVFSGHLSSPLGFFPADGGEPRQLSTDGRGFGLPVFVSSNEGYFGVPRRDGVATVKREYRYDDEGVTIIEGWSRDLGLGPVSGDGAWLVGRRATEAHVLDASTGETVFVHPFTNPVDYSLRIHDGRLVLGHEVGDPEEIARCRGKSEVVSRACFADLRERGGYRTVYDVYDLRTLADGGSPDHYRVEYGENPHCGSGDDPFGTLEVRDEQLVYVPRT